MNFQSYQKHWQCFKDIAPGNVLRYNRKYTDLESGREFANRPTWV